MKYLFGPVPSRRLGRSLGIDVVPSKTCTYDCVYCESGRTTRLTLKRATFVSPDRVLQDLDRYFAEHPQGADVLTFSSAGEPTLYEPLGDLVRSIKQRFRSLPLVVLTNGSLLWDPRVRKDLMAADRVVPSLDAATEEVFREINRPHPGLNLSSILEGLEAFCRDYKGQVHIEVLLASGINDHADELRRIARVMERLAPHRVELNTVVRPPAYPFARCVSPKEMERALQFFPRQKTQVIGKFCASCRQDQDADLALRVLNTVRRRPCTVQEMAASLGVTVGELEDSVKGLERQGLLLRSQFNELEYLCASV